MSFLFFFRERSFVASLDFIGKESHRDGELGQIPEVALQSLQSFLCQDFIVLPELPKLLVESEIVHSSIRSAAGHQKVRNVDSNMEESFSFLGEVEFCLPAGNCDPSSFREISTSFL